MAQEGKRVQHSAPAQHRDSQRSDRSRRDYDREPPHNDPPHRRRKKKRTHGKLGVVFTIIELILWIVFGVTLIRLNMLPTVLTAVVLVVLLAVIIGIGFMIGKAQGKARVVVGIILDVLVGALMVVGSAYMLRGMSALNNITNTKTEVAVMNVYVRTDDAAQSLSDAAGYSFGIMGQLDRENTDKAVAQLNQDLGTTISTQEFEGSTELVDALLNHTVDAIVMNAAYVDLLQETEGYENVTDQIRVLAEKQTETEVVQPTEDTNLVESPTGVFTMYISGIDSRSGLVAKSRSDVNIIATVNTETKQVLLVSTPRDYYVPLSISNGVRDKLTHAGIYGIDVSVDTLEMLYGINIDYYFRVNFSGFENIIDALGGVTVQSDYDFSTGEYTFVKGANTLNGSQALAFARERHAFADGDHQRGRDQMAVIKGVINKLVSPSFLTNYNSVLTAIEGNFETTVPSDVIASLVRQQLSDGGDWNVVSYSVSGTGAHEKPYSMSTKAYVMWPDENTVATAQELMRQVRDGEILTQP